MLKMKEALLMKVKYLGHACFQFDDGQYKVLVDPFLTGNPVAAESPDKVEADYIFVTHGHGDHIGDALAIAKRTGAVICTTVDLAEAMMQGTGLEIVTGNIGGTISFPFGTAKYFQALHGSGAAGTVSCGFIFEIGKRKIYHAGDTGLTMDMQLLADEELDAALLPIGDYYTMGPKDAVRAAEMLRAKVVIPMQYSTFRHIRQDPARFVRALEDKGMEGIVVKPGEIIEL